MAAVAKPACFTNDLLFMFLFFNRKV